MSSPKKNSFLFDSNDSDQQILPFDFLDEEDDEEEEKNIEVLEKTALVKENDSKQETKDSFEEEPVAPTETITELGKEKAEEMEKYSPSSENKVEDLEKTDPKIIEPKSSIEEARKSSESELKEIITETVKIPTQEKAKADLSPKKEDKKASVVFSASGLKPGQILQEARVRKDLSLDQVALSTKIKRSYIEALENGDNSNLPATVFVEAYIKTLCSVYDIDPSQVRQGIVRQKPGKVVPGELLHHIEEGKQVNFEEEAKINKILKVAAIIIILLALAVYSGIKLSGPGKTNQPTDQPEITKPEPPEKLEPKITSKDLEVFIYQQPFTMTEMKLPEKGTENSSDNI